MRHQGYLYPFILLLMGLYSCKATEEVAEMSANKMLDEARALLEQKCYTAARDTILSLRQQHPTALNARRAAILTLDSIELLQTRDSVARYEKVLNEERARFAAMQPRVGGRTNEAYYAQQRLLFDMQQHFDELCAKAKFYVRKIDIDKSENENNFSPDPTSVKGSNSEGKEWER